MKLLKKLKNSSMMGFASPLFLLALVCSFSFFDFFFLILYPLKRFFLCWLIFVLKSLSQIKDGRWSEAYNMEDENRARIKEIFWEGKRAMWIEECDIKARSRIEESNHHIYILVVLVIYPMMDKQKAKNLMFSKDKSKLIWTPQRSHPYKHPKFWNHVYKNVY